MKSKGEVEQFTRLLIQFPKLLDQFIELSKKRPNDVINEFKLSLINPLLQSANSILGDDNKPYAEFGLFDSESLPTNSDVVVILSQYLACLQKFRRENIVYHEGRHYWLIGGKRSSMEAS